MVSTTKIRVISDTSDSIRLDSSVGTGHDWFYCPSVKINASGRDETECLQAPVVTRVSISRTEGRATVEMQTLAQPVASVHSPPLPVDVYSQSHNQPSSHATYSISANLRVK